MKHALKMRILTMLLAVIMVVGYIPAAVFATEVEGTEPVIEVIAEEPTEAPAEEPTEAPAEEPTEAPAEEPTEAPAEEPTEAPAEEPTEAPAEEPTEAPAEEPTEAPAEEPTEAPAEEPTEAPAEEPTEAPAEELTEAPAEIASKKQEKLAAAKSGITTGWAESMNREHMLAPGITLNEIVAIDGDGARNEIYVAIADLSVNTVKAQANYKDNQNQNLGMSTLSSQVAAAEAKHEEPYAVVAAVNGMFYNQITGAPGGANVMEGVVGPTDPDRPANNRPFLAIVDNGDGTQSAVIGNSGEWNAFYASHTVVEAIGGERQLLDNGEKYQGGAGDKVGRSAIGVTAEGKVVMLSVDGARAPASIGTHLTGLQEIMLSLGCVDALLLDGGGSTTFGARLPGADSFAIVNTPSDGAERTIANSFMFVSTAAPDGTFDRATLTAENEYVTPESQVNVTAVGVDIAGGAAEIPADAVWALADDTMGTVANGVFTASDKSGDAVVQLKVNGKVVGETTIHVVIPEIAFRQNTLVFPYGKQATLEIVATTNNGLNSVVLKNGDVIFTLSDPAMGTLDGNKFTACAETAGVTAGTITATLAYGTDVAATANVVFGRGSEIIYDFEEGAIPTGMEAKSGYYYEDKYGRYEKASAEIVTAANGKVRNGEYALAVTSDFSDLTSAGSYAVVLEFPDIDLTGATSVGLWMYLDVEDLNGFFFGFCDDDKGKSGHRYYPFEYTAGKEGSGMEEDGWYYISMDLSEVKFNTLGSIRFYARDNTETIWNPYNKHTIFIDDLTVDYSVAVDDREAPVFSKINCDDSDGLTLSAMVEENTEKINHTGIDSATAAVYVDGVKLTSGFTYADGKLMVSAQDMPDGHHTIRFEIADYAGNYASAVHELDLNGSYGDVYFTPADPDATLVPIGSVQWFNLVAKNIENVDALTAVVDLDSMSQWELKGMDVAYGFESSYVIDKFTNTATITFVRTGVVEATGETILASLPVRTREWNAHLDEDYIADDRVGDDPGDHDDIYVLTPHAMWHGDAAILTRMEVQLDSAVVTYRDDSTASFSSERIYVMTECNRWRANAVYSADGTYKETSDLNELEQGKKSWHIHNAGVATDKPATCTEDGYIGRIFCVGCECGTEEAHSCRTSYRGDAVEEKNYAGGVKCDTHDGCGSVIDWGTTVKATGHTYELNAETGKMACACDKLLTGEKDGKSYVDGVLLNGWVDDTYYYVDGVKITGRKVMNKKMYTFDKNGVYQKNEFFKGFYQDPANGKWMYFNANEAMSGFILVDDQWYYFMPDCYAATGTQTISGLSYKFKGEKGAVIGAWQKTSSGTRFYFCRTYYKNVWAEIEGEKYYFDNNGYRYEGAVCVTHLKETLGCWKFDENGKFVEKITGVFRDARTGYYHYAIDGELQLGSGLVKWNGNIYYVRANGRLATTEWYVSQNALNGLVDKAGNYVFLDDGRMVKESGVVKIGDSYYYQINGEPQAGLGLIQWKGNLYYVRSNGKIATSVWYVGEDALNGLAEKAGNFLFGSDGKLQKITCVANPYGNANYYYFVDGQQQYGAGLTKWGNSIYYVRSNGKVATEVWYVGQNSLNGLAERDGNFLFGADGKLQDVTCVDNPYGNASYYYFAGGQQQYGLGLVRWENDTYYVRSNGKVATTEWYVGTSALNGLAAKAGTYVFGADGKMEKINGVVQYEDGYYYYVEGIPQKGVGLVQWNGDIYYVRSNGKLATTDWYVGKTALNGLLQTPGTYAFGADGKLAK